MAKKQKTELEKWGEVVTPNKDESFKPKDFKDLVVWYRQQILSGSPDESKNVFLKLSEGLLTEKVKTKLKPKKDAPKKPVE